MNQIEHRLTKDAQTWQAAVDATNPGSQRAGLPTAKYSHSVHGHVRRWRLPVLAAVAVVALTCLVVVLGGTSHNSDRNASGGSVAQPTGPAVVDPIRPALPRSVAVAFPVASPVPILTPTQGAGLTSLPWALSTKPSGSSLDIYYAQGDGSCTLPVGIQVVETSSTVEVWALSKTDYTRVACASPLKSGRGLVALSQPLGNRTLLHGPVDKVWVQALPG